MSTLIAWDLFENGEQPVGVRDGVQTKLGGTADHREAVEAFLAERSPVFPGR